MRKPLLYRKLGKYYNFIYSFKDYKKEAKYLKTLVKKYKKSAGNELLDAACGSGIHLKYLKDSFSCMGFDLNDSILAVAKKNIMGVKFRKADMVMFNLHKKFDVITCLFSAIGYAKTYPNLKKTMLNFSKHLKKGGVVIIEPWISPSNFRSGHSDLRTYSSKDLKIARISISKRVGTFSRLEMCYLILEKNKIKYFKDFHELGLFDVNKTLKIMKEVGFVPIFLKKGFGDRGLYVGVKN